MTYFIFGDVHGFYNELIEALDKAGFDKTNPEHYIISLGDATDRGEQSKEVLEFLMDLYNQNRATLIQGNHEDLLIEAITRGYCRQHDIHNGATQTVCQLTGLTDPDEALRAMRDNKLWNSYIEATVDYYELGDNIFVHGWIPCSEEYTGELSELPDAWKPTIKVYTPNWRQGDWSEARWYNGMSLWTKGIVEPGKTIYCGHWHSSWGNSYLHNDGKEFLRKFETYYIDPDTGKQEPHVNHEPFIDQGIVAMDACTVLSHKVNVVSLQF